MLWSENKHPFRGLPVLASLTHRAIITPVSYSSWISPQASPITVVCATHVWSTLLASHWQNDRYSSVRGSAQTAVIDGCRSGSPRRDVTSDAWPIRSASNGDFRWPLYWINDGTTRKPMTRGETLLIFRFRSDAREYCASYGERKVDSKKMLWINSLC